MLYIRKEKKSDYEEVYRVNSEAFETHDEAELVNSLRKNSRSYTFYPCLAVRI